MNINKINSSDNNNSNLKTKCSKAWKNIPLFIRLITFITIILYVLNLFFPIISLKLSNIPYFTIFKMHLWRIISTILITTEILNILFSLIFWVKYASEIESSMGTIKYFIIFMMNSIIIQILYSIISCLIALIINNKNYLQEKLKNKNEVMNSGLWPYIICELTLLSLSNPNQQMSFLFFPCQFRAKFYPLILFIIFSIMNSFIIDLEVLMGIIYAFIYHFFMKKKIKISDNFVRKIENSKVILCFTKMGGFVSVNNLGNKLVSTVNNINMKMKDISISQNNRGFTPFRGQGVKIGGNYGEATDGYAGVNQNTSSNMQKSQNESLDVKI
jgi:membrane associated rhomboid family serine protease